MQFLLILVLKQITEIDFFIKSFDDEVVLICLVQRNNKILITVVKYKFT